MFLQKCSTYHLRSSYTDRFLRMSGYYRNAHSFFRIQNRTLTFKLFIETKPTVFMLHQLISLIVDQSWMQSMREGEKIKCHFILTLNARTWGLPGTIPLGLGFSVTGVGDATSEPAKKTSEKKHKLISDTKTKKYVEFVKLVNVFMQIVHVNE